MYRVDDSDLTCLLRIKNGRSAKTASSSAIIQFKFFSIHSIQHQSSAARSRLELPLQPTGTGTGTGTTIMSGGQLAAASTVIVAGDFDDGSEVNTSRGGRERGGDAVSNTTDPSDPAKNTKREPGVDSNSSHTSVPVTVLLTDVVDDDVVVVQRKGDAIPDLVHHALSLESAALLAAANNSKGGGSGGNSQYQTVEIKVRIGAVIALESGCW